jgi:hypothetical protein
MSPLGLGGPTLGRRSGAADAETILRAIPAEARGGAWRPGCSPTGGLRRGPNLSSPPVRAFKDERSSLTGAAPIVATMVPPDGAAQKPHRKKGCCVAAKRFELLSSVLPAQPGAVLSRRRRGEHQHLVGLLLSQSRQHEEGCRRVRFEGEHVVVPRSEQGCNCGCRAVP